MSKKTNNYNNHYPTPFINFNTFAISEDARIKYGHHISDIKYQARRHSNGLISIHVYWSSSGGYFKYCSLGYRSYSKFENSMILDFPEERYFSFDCKSYFPCSIEVGLRIKDINYKPIYFDNLKYEVMVYFAPEGWIDNKKPYKSGQCNTN